MNKIILKKPVTTVEGTTTVINFTEPTGMVIAQCGVPMKPLIDEGGDKSAPADGAPKGKSEMRIDAEAVHRLIAACGGVSTEVVDLLSPQDWMAAMGVVIGFFGDSVPTAPAS